MTPCKQDAARRNPQGAAGRAAEGRWSVIGCSVGLHLPEGGRLVVESVTSGQWLINPAE